MGKMITDDPTHDEMLSREASAERERSRARLTPRG
jgi:hypothetical protein